MKIVNLPHLLLPLFLLLLLGWSNNNSSNGNGNNKKFDKLIILNKCEQRKCNYVRD